MINEQVATWLNGDRDYEQGLALLKELQPGSLSVIILETGEDEYNQNLLAAELLKGLDFNKEIHIPD